MRNLQTTDIFSFVRLINKIGIKEELKQKATAQNADVESLGYDLIFMVLEKAAEPEAEKEIYSFFAPIFETTEEELRVMDPLEFVEKISTVASWERWKSFFSSAAKLTKSK
jgi:hypothetical protein